MKKKILTHSLNQRKKINYFIKNFPDSEYALDLKFKIEFDKQSTRS